MRFAHKALRRLHDTDRAPGLPQNLVPRIRRILGTLRVAAKPSDVDIPGYGLHPLKGDRAGYRAFASAATGASSSGFATASRSTWISSTTTRRPT